MLRILSVCLALALWLCWGGTASAQSCYGSGGYAYPPPSTYSYAPPSAYGYMPPANGYYSNGNGNGNGYSASSYGYPSPAYFAPPSVREYRGGPEAYEVERRYGLRGQVRFERYRGGPSTYSSPRYVCGPNGCYVVR